MSKQYNEKDEAEFKNMIQTMTKKLLALLREKAKAYKQHSKRPADIQLKNSFKQILATVIKEIRAAKKNYYSTILDEHITKPKKNTGT